MGKTALHHYIFRIITIVLIAATFFSNIFSNVIAHLILIFSILVCSIWLFVNIIILGIRMKQREDFISGGLGFEPLFYIIPLAMTTLYIIYG